MPASTIDLAFIKQYEAEVHEAYQRMGSKLRGTVRVKSGVVGSSTTFQKVGKGTASTKARNAQIAAMGVVHTPVECTLADWYAGDWVDKLDEAKTNIDERRVIANAGAYALGRKTDDLIIAALEAVGSGQNVTGAGNLADTVGFTSEKVFAALEILNGADVPDDGQRFAVVSPAAWTDLMAITAFASAEYVGADLPYKAGAGSMRSWLGIQWMTHSGLIVNGGGDRQCYIYHRSAVGHAVGAEVTSDITWHGDHAAHFVNHMMSQGSVAIDATGIARIIISE